MRSIEQIGPRNFLYEPDPIDPFTFHRSTGEKVRPGRFTFDFGSVPVLLRGLPYLSPIEYGPTYLIHDWDFHLRKVEGQGYLRSFKDANETLKEGLRTLRDIGHNGTKYDSNDWTIYAIFRAVNSPVGLSLWESPMHNIHDIQDDLLSKHRSRVRSLLEIPQVLESLSSLYSAH